MEVVVVVVAQRSKQFARPSVHKGLVLGIPARVTRNSARNRLPGSEGNREHGSGHKNAPNLASDTSCTLCPGQNLMSSFPQESLS